MAPIGVLNVLLQQSSTTLYIYTRNTTRVCCPVCVCTVQKKNARSIKGVHWTCVRVAPGYSTFLTISTVHNVWNRRWYNNVYLGDVYIYIHKN